MILHCAGLRRTPPTRRHENLKAKKATRASRDQQGSYGHTADSDGVLMPTPSDVVGQLFTSDDSYPKGHIAKAKAATLTTLLLDPSVEGVSQPRPTPTYHVY